MRNLKVLKNLKLSTGLPNAAIVAAVEGGGEGAGIQPSRILNIELSLNFFYDIHEIFETIKLQNVPVYDSAKIEEVEGLQPEDLITVSVEIPTSKKDDVYGQIDYGDAICGNYKDDNEAELVILKTTSGSARAIEFNNYILIDSDTLRLTAPLNVGVDNTLRLNLLKEL